MKKKPWYVYVIYSVTTGRLFTGISLDPHKKLTQHNAGRGGKFTKIGRPYRIVWMKKCENKSLALKMEINVKKMDRTKKLVMTGLAA